jgi:hypothetical protein
MVAGFSFLVLLEYAGAYSLDIGEKRRSSAKRLNLLVPAHGLEPRFTPSKGAVLPLDEAGKAKLPD